MSSPEDAGVSGVSGGIQQLKLEEGEGDQQSNQFNQYWDSDWELYLSPRSAGGAGSNHGETDGMKQTTEKMEGLEGSRSTPTVDPAAGKEGGTGSGGAVLRDLEMMATRREEAFERRLVRRALWVGESRRVIEERRRFQQSGTTALFPELVWEPILMRVDDAKVKARMANMSLLWNELLLRERTKFLFDDMFPLLNEKGMLSRDDILSFRGVCREWKESAETWLQNFSDYYQPLTMLEKLDIRKPSYPSPKLAPFKFRDGHARMASFTDWAMPRYGRTENPFFSRRLVLGHSWFRNFGGIGGQLYIEAQRLLTLWGREVWTVGIELGNIADSKEGYDLVCNILKLMPNLRTLTIKVSVDSVNLDYHYTMLLNTHMVENPLPQLPHLKVMRVASLPPRMLKAMLNHFGPTLTSLIVDGVHVHQSCPVGDANLPNLKQLSISSDRLFLAVIPSAGIEELHLSCTYWDVGTAAAITTLFRNLNNFGGQLRKLSIILDRKNERPVNPDDPTWEMLPLELPHLEEFSFGCTRANLKTIDFILPMRCLKKLSITDVKKWPAKFVDVDELPEPGVIIKFWGYTNRLYESNIWSLFPELKQVTVNSILEKPVVTGTFFNMRPRETFWGPTRDDEKDKTAHERSYTRQAYVAYCSGEWVD